MKWAVLLLIVLGLVAALSASFLVNALRTEKRAELRGKGEVEAVVATRSLPAMSWITSRHIKVEKVARKGVARDYFSDPVQVMGKVLAVPVVEGQVLARSCLITEGSGAQLAAALPHGMRAVSVPVSGHAVMGGLLYPGCLVDVIATFRLRSRETSKGEAISTTLLHSVQVLAVEGESIISKPEELGQKSKLVGSRPSSQMTVTLMVDTRQAEALQLAMNNGKITLAMRNPLDQRMVDADAMVYSEGRLAKLGELLTPSVFAVPTGELGDMDVNNLMAAGADPNELRALLDSSGSAGQDYMTQARNAEQLRRIFGSEFGGGFPQQWEITVIRGQEVKEELFDLSDEEALAQQENK